MSKRTTLLSALAVSAVVLVGGGGLGWTWLHKSADAKLEAALQNFQSRLPPGSSFTYRKATALPLGHGARLTDVVFKDGAVTLEATGMELLGASDPGPAGTADTTPAVGTPLHLAHLIAYTVHVQGPVGDTKIKRLAVDDLSLASGWSSLNDVTFAHGELADLSAAMQDGSATLALQDMGVDNFGRGHLSRLLVRRFDLHGLVKPARHIAFARLSQNGVDLALQLQAAMRHEILPAPDGVSDMKIEDALIEGEVSPSDTAMKPLLAVKTVKSHGTTTNGKQQQVLSLTHMRLWPSVPQFAFLKTLGYENFDGSVTVKIAMDDSAQAMHIVLLDISAPKFGRLDVSGDVSDINIHGASGVAGAALAAKLVRLEAGWRDDGLVGRIIRSASIGQGVDPDAYIGVLTRSLAPEGSSPQEVGPQLARYIANPAAGTLRATIQPPEPLALIPASAALSMALNPSIASQLGLVVKAPDGSGKDLPAAGQTDDGASVPAGSSTDEGDDPGTVVAPPAPGGESPATAAPEHAAPQP